MFDVLHSFDVSFQNQRLLDKHKTIIMSDNVVEQLENLNVKDNKKVSELFANDFHIQIHCILIDFIKYTCVVVPNIGLSIKRGYDLDVNCCKVKN